MPRFIVTICDPTTREIASHIQRIDNPVDAICNHPWITYMYKNTWVASHIFALTQELCIANIMEQLGWVVLCENLDDKIMNVLNGGDSSASSFPAAGIDVG